MKKAIVIGTLVAALAVWCSIRSNAAQPASTRPASTQPAATRPAREVFRTELSITAPAAHTEFAADKPVLAGLDGMEGSFQAGGEFPFGEVEHAQYYQYGFEATSIVHRIAADKLFVCIYAAHNDLGDKPKWNNVEVRQSGLRVIREIKPGDTVTLDLGGGWVVKGTVSAGKPD
jgi:hypothetical protein